MDQERRLVVGTVLTLGITGVAGCSNRPSETAETSDTTAPPDTLTPPSLMVQNENIRIEWAPELQDRVSEQHRATFDIHRNGYSLDDLELVVEKDGETRRHTVENSTTVLSAPELFDGDQEAYLEYDGQNTEPVTVNKNTPDAFVVDVRDTNNQSLTSWTTDYSFDDHTVDLEKLDWWHGNDYLEFGETEFVNRITQDQIVQETPYYVYSNYDNPDTRDRGEWNFEKFQEADTLKQKFEWLGPAWLNYQDQELGGTTSTHQFKFAPTTEEVFDRYTEFEIHAWGFNSPMIDEDGGNHGSNLLHDQTNNQLYVVDQAPKTNQFIATPENSNYNPANGHSVTERVWHPLWYQGKNPDTPQLNYKEAKSATIYMLFGMVSQDSEGDEQHAGTNQLTATDQYILDALDTLRQGGLDEVYEQLKFPNEKIANSSENDVVLYGAADDPRYVVGSGDIMNELINDINISEETFTIQDIEKTLNGTTTTAAA